MLGKRTLLLAALAALSLLALPWGSAQAGVRVNIGVGAPCYRHHHYYRPCYRPAVVIAPRPVIVARPAVVVAPAPVYVQPSYCPAP